MRLRAGLVGGCNKIILMGLKLTSRGVRSGSVPNIWSDPTSSLVWALVSRVAVAWLKIGVAIVGQERGS